MGGRERGRRLRLRGDGERVSEERGGNEAHSFSARCHGERGGEAGEGGRDIGVNRDGERDCWRG